MQLMLQSSLFDSFAFDPFSFEQDGMAASKVDVGRVRLAMAVGRNEGQQPCAIKHEY